MAVNPFLAGQQAARGQNPVPAPPQRDLGDVVKLRAFLNQQQQAMADRAREEQQRALANEVQQRAVAGAPEDVRDLVRTPEGFEQYVKSRFATKTKEPKIFGSAESGYFQFGEDGKAVPLVGAVPRDRSGEPLMSVLGPDGKAVYLPRSQAIGMEPAGSRDDKSFTQENQLRTQWNTLVKPYREVAQGYDKIKASLGLGTGAGDTAAIFAYAKILDPSSVVRESEFAQMQNVGGIVGKLSSLYGQAKDGQLLRPEMRSEILRGATAQIQPYRTQYDSMVQNYTDIAAQGGLEPSRVISSVVWPSLSDEVGSGEPEATGDPTIDGLPDADVIGAFE